MDDQSRLESRLFYGFAACVCAIVIGAGGFVFASHEVKERVDRRVDARVCRLMTIACPAPNPATRGD